MSRARQEPRETGLAAMCDEARALHPMVAAQSLLRPRAAVRPLWHRFRHAYAVASATAQAVPGTDQSLRPVVLVRLRGCSLGGEPRAPHRKREPG
jgi:hypothetical protein